VADHRDHSDYAEWSSRPAYSHAGGREPARTAAPVARIDDLAPTKITTNTVGNQSTRRVKPGYCELVD
jgi:hypothetical protein